eukprot:m.295261 g.295261  ORF g.295261 m.295261 type:complete len:699 (+) comp19511_c0_seq9:32-2128(+)
MAWLGDKLEDFEVLETVGHGGFASVCKARSRKCGHFVALKMIDKRHPNFDQLANRVKSEVEIHSRLKHDAILELYGCFEDDEKVYLVLELAAHGELQSYMTKTLCRCFTEEEARQMLAQVVRGLQYLHSHGIMHRDISVSNLLLTADMKLKIADFGLAVKLIPGNANVTMCGTANFISPEVAGRHPHGLQTDIWSLGCLLFTMLAGKPPFQAEGLEAGVQGTLERVSAGHYETPSHFSAPARDLVARLLQQDPDKRLALDQVLEHPFMKPKPRHNDTHVPAQIPLPGNVSQPWANSHSSLLASRNSKRRMAGPLHWSTASSTVLRRPLSTDRLRPLTHTTDTATVCIDTDGRVVLTCSSAVTGSCNSSPQDETFVVSSDGLSVRHTVQDSSVDATFHSLSHGLHRRYVYAARFVELVKAKTPKVTLYSDLAKCLLMENGPPGDFDVRFYSGMRIIVTSATVHVMDATGHAVQKLERSQLEEHRSESLSNSVAAALDHTLECLQQCEHLAQVHSQFPVSVGRRPHKHRHSRSQQRTRVGCCKSFGGRPSAREPLQVQQRPHSLDDHRLASKLQPYDAARYSSGLECDKVASSPQHALGKFPRTLTACVCIPQLGWGSLLTTGETWAQFCDGTEALLSADGATLELDQHKPDNATVSSFQVTSALPVGVKEVLSRLAVIVKALRMQQEESGLLPPASKSV